MQLPTITLTERGPWAENSSPESLRDLLGLLEQKAVEAGCPFRAMTRPGLPEGEIRDRLVEHGLEPEPEAVVWFAWHDGQRNLNAQMLPNTQMMTLDQALDLYRTSLTVLEELKGDRPEQSVGRGIDLGWLPLVGDTHGQAIDCGAARTRPPDVRNYSDSFYAASMRKRNAMVGVSLCTLVVWWIQHIETYGATWNPAAEMWDLDFTNFPPSKRDAFFS